MFAGSVRKNSARVARRVLTLAKSLVLQVRRKLRIPTMQKRTRSCYTTDEVS